MSTGKCDVSSIQRRMGRVSLMGLIGCGSAIAVIVLATILWRMGDPADSAATVQSTASGKEGRSGSLVVYCAAGMRYPLDEIAKRYQREYGVAVSLQYGGSNTLLNQLEVSRTGDLYLAADGYYIELARNKDLVDESLPLARMKPVIVVPAANPLGIESIADLVTKEARLGLGDPEAAAVGKKVRKLLSASGAWPAIESLARKKGVFKQTVNEVANAVKIGSVDAGLIWDSTVGQYPELRGIEVPELDRGESLVQIGVLRSSKRPTAALHFARYVAAHDRGLETFRSKGFRAVDGDVWEDHPRLVFFAGSVNRRALEPIIKRFEEREGVTVQTVFNGCGILTAQMQTLKSGGGSGFPDAYMACDVYYLDVVRELFQDDVVVSETDIVIVVQKGNPKRIERLEDLVRPGVRVAVGQPEQCTIGVLSRRLLESAGIYEKCLQNNVVTQTATSALLVPTVVTRSADATLAYRTDTLATRGEIDVVSIESEHAKAVQPFAVARTSPHKQLVRRLFSQIAQSRDIFEEAGFAWRLRESDRRRRSAQRGGGPS